MEDIKQEQRNETNDSDAVVDALIDYSENYVSKAEVNEIIAEKDAKIAKLVQAVKKGSSLKEEESQPKLSVKELADKLSTQGDIFNVDGVKLAMEYRQACMDAGMRDPLLPNSRDYNYSEIDAQKADFIAQKLEGLVMDSEGNPRNFNMMSTEIIK